MRRWLLGGGILLVAVIAGLIGYARHRARAALLDLPRLLGADIKSETDGYTYSQTVKGRTLFTIHAAKAVQHRNGKTTLHNVSVTLYGEPGSHRVDRIRGAEFEYDQGSGVVRAMGESEIDLASPSDAADTPTAKRIHVIASGLVFQQKLGTASTEEPIRFDDGEVHGSARGADFDAHTGMLQLHHDVHITSTEGSHAQQVDASAAHIDRGQRTALLTQATLSQAGDSVRAAQMLLHLRPENTTSGNSLQCIDGTGGVLLHTADGRTAEAPVLHVTLTEKNRPEQATLTGGVTLRGTDDDGHAASALLQFNAQGRASHVRLQGAVVLHQRGVVAGSARDLSADIVDGTLTTDAAGHTALQQSVATGHAALRLVDAPTAGKPARQTTLSADTLRTVGSPTAGRGQVREVIGDGATRVEDHVTGGEDRISTGAHVDILLSATAAQANAVESFVQQGHVHAVERRPATAKVAARESIADADRAEYLAGAGTVVLIGAPMVRDNSMQVAAGRIQIDTTTGDAQAFENVKGSYRNQANVAEPADHDNLLHFLADRAVTHGDAHQATLFGAAHPARLWNGSAQIEAPIVEIDQAKGTLLAHDAADGHLAQPVHAILPAANGPSAKQDRGTVRLLSHALQYRGAAGAAPAQVIFTGGVRMDTGQGQVQCDTVTALLHSSAKGNSSAKGSTGLFGGAVETVTAEGGVRVLQPGRVATGARLLYTAASQQFLLTGTPGALPTVRDSVQGNVTGTALLFHAGDDSVEITGSPGQPVRTEIDAPPRNATNRGKPGITGGKPAADRKK